MPSQMQPHPYMGCLLLALCIKVLLLQYPLPARASSTSPSVAKPGFLCYHDARFNPTYQEQHNTHFIWQIPPNPRAVLYIASGRYSDIFSFFDRSPGCELCNELPEDRTVVLEAMDRKYAVIVVKSLGDEWDSWPVETSQDKVAVTSILTNWVAEHDLHNLPLVGFGYSSGGNFTSMMAPFLGLKSLVILDSLGRYEALENVDERIYPPTLYFYMPKDSNITGQIFRNAKMMRAQGVEVELIPIYEFPVTPDLFALRNPCISNDKSARIFRALLDANFLDESLLLKFDIWDFNYYSWINSSWIVSECMPPATCFWNQVVQELGSAYAFYSMSSMKKDAMFEWFESSVTPTASFS